MGLTKMAFWRYMAITLVGSVPNLALFVDPGAQLGVINPAESVLTPSAILALAMIGLFPWMARQLIERLQRRT